MMATSAFAQLDHSALKAELYAFNDQFNAYAAAHDIEGIVGLYGETSLWIAPDARPAPGQVLARNTVGFLVANEGSLVHTVDTLILSQDGSQAAVTTPPLIVRACLL